MFGKCAALAYFAASGPANLEAMDPVGLVGAPVDKGRLTDSKGGRGRIPSRWVQRRVPYKRRGADPRRVLIDGRKIEIAVPGFMFLPSMFLPVCNRAQCQPLQPADK